MTVALIAEPGCFADTYHEARFEVAMFAREWRLWVDSVEKDVPMGRMDPEEAI